MRRPVSNSAVPNVDWKGLGYLVSIASALLLGAIAWPKPNDPKWHVAVLVLGVTTSIIGMGCRYKAHLDEQQEIRKAKAKVEHS